VIPGVPDFGFGPAPEPGVPVTLAPGLVRLTAPNPGLMTGPGTNSYLIGGTGRPAAPGSVPDTADAGGLVVVDPGPDHDGHREALLAAASDMGATVGTILVTHTHVDHAPGAAALAAATGARVVGFGPDENFTPDESVAGGWLLVVDEGLTLEAMHTPGHASNHLCWLLREQRILLTGDHVMHGSTVVIRPPDGDLAAYLASLALLRSFTPPLGALAPGHGRMMDHVADVADALIAHRLARHAIVAEALATAGEASVDDLLPEVYADVTEPQLPVARFSLWAHLRQLTAEGRAEVTGAEARGEAVEDTIESRWRALAPMGAGVGA
jgi:glyoxylase-like metal-dependent hydrolase (beta-lactamase superfamily II)